MINLFIKLRYAFLKIFLMLPDIQEAFSKKKYTKETFDDRVPPVFPRNWPAFQF
jgi:hypothetical protein